MLTGFDHFIILVNNLDTAIASFHRLGFDARAGGEHPSFGSHNALVALADGTYIELVAFKDSSLARTTYWRAGVERLRVSEGWGGFVLASNAITTDVVRLQTSLAYNAPQAGARVRPDGQRVEWHTSMFNASLASSATMPSVLASAAPPADNRQAMAAAARDSLRILFLPMMVRPLAGAALHLVRAPDPKTDQDPRPVIRMIAVP